MGGICRQRKQSVMHLLAHCNSHLSSILAAPAASQEDAKDTSAAAAAADGALAPEAETGDGKLVPVMEAFAYQAVAEATLAVTLAVLQGVSEDSGEIAPHGAPALFCEAQPADFRTLALFRAAQLAHFRTLCCGCGGATINSC